MAFAKLFETKEHGQILVKIDRGEEGPEIRYFFEPEGLGVSSMAISFDQDTDKNWDVAEKIFDEVTEEQAVKSIQLIKDQMHI